MNVVVLIEGREAIPVRAIPILANWRFMSPDIVAHVLGGTGGSNVGLFGDMQSNHIEDGKVQHLKKDYWVQFPLMELQALSEKIKADESSHEAGYSEWRKQSLKVLPAGVFVWKDEYQALHDKNWNSRYKMTYCALRDWNSEGEAEESDEENESPIQRKLTREELVKDIAIKRDLRESLEILNRWREPNYSPFMLPELCTVVMEGFEPATPPAPEVTVSVSADDSERLAKLNGMHDRMNDPAYRRDLELVEVESGRLEKARERYAKWNQIGDGGTSVGLDLKETRLEDTKKELDELEEKHKVMRGDIFPERKAVTVETNKKWTHAKLAELAIFRGAHTMPETAAKYGISEQRIRQLLPSKNTKASPFTGLIHRTK